MNKRCPKCTQTLPLTEFWKDSSSKDGVQWACRVCAYKARRASDAKASPERLLRDYRRSAAYDKKRRACDPVFRLRKVLRERLNKILHGRNKTGSAVADLGCTPEKLKKYLEARFEPGMTWENYGTWHIDHVVPLAAFDLTNRKDLLKACNFKNLQPLWEIDNLKKGDKCA